MTIRRDPQETGQKQSQPHFRADRDQQMTATTGTNPDPPAKRSASAPADSVPPAQVALGPYPGAWG